MTVIFPLKEAGDKLFSQELQGLRNDILTRGEFVVATGSSNAFAITIDDNDGGAGLDEEPITWPLANGHVVMFEANHSIDGAATLNVNGNGAIAIQARGSEALVEGDIVSGQFVICFYDSGSNVFQMLSVSAIPVETVIRQQNSGILTAGETLTVSSQPLSCFIGQGASSADTFTSPSQAVNGSDFNCYGANWVGNTFISSFDVINSVTLYLDEVGTAPGNFDVSIYATSGGVPTGAALATASVLGTAVPNADAEVVFTFSSPLAVTKGGRYAVVASLPSGVNSSNCVQVRYAATGNYVYANGTYMTSVNSGSSWTPGAATDALYMKIIGYESGNTRNDDFVIATQVTENANFLAYAGEWAGQTFPATVDFLTSVVLKLDEIGIAPGNFEVAIYATSAGLPTGSPLGKVGITATTVSDTDAETTFTFGDPIGLIKGDAYAIVASLPSGVNSSNCIELRYQSTGTPYASGSRLSSSNSGSTWTASATSALYFRIRGYEKIELGKVYLSDSDMYQRRRFDGFVRETAAANAAVEIQTDGIASGFSGLVAGKEYSISATAGGISQAYGLGFIGYALGTDRIQINKSYPQCIGYLDSPAIAGATLGYGGTVAYALPGTRMVTYDVTHAAALSNRYDQRFKMYIDDEVGYSDAVTNSTANTLAYIRLTAATRKLSLERSNATDNVTIPAGRFRFYK